MKQLIIIGAGGFGREILGWAKESAGYRSEWEIAGFLDDNPEALKAFPDIGLPLLGNTHEFAPQPEHVFIIAMGSPHLRCSIRERFEAREAEFVRIIHESCVIGSRVHLEPGVVLCPRVVLTCDISIGKNTALNVSSAVGHYAVIGSDFQISSF